MCGRFTQCLSWTELRELMDLVSAPLNQKPRYNIAPSHDVAVVGATANGRHLSMLRWGLIPADGFYEWQRRRGTRQPWHFGLRFARRVGSTS